MSKLRCVQGSSSSRLRVAAFTRSPYLKIQNIDLSNFYNCNAPIFQTPDPPLIKAVAADILREHKQMQVTPAQLIATRRRECTKGIGILIRELPTELEMELNFITTLIKHDVNYNVRKCFKSKKPFDTRKEEVLAIRSKFPTKIPLIVEKYYKERTLPALDKTKFLVPEEITMSQFLVIIRNRMAIKPNQALYLIMNNRSMLSMSLTMAQAYEHYSDEDGFLYITYASQEVFGYQDDIVNECKEVQAIRTRFPNKVPLFVERYSREREVPELERNKFLVPQELTMSQFLYIIRTKMKLKDSQALYLMVNSKVLASHSMTMAQAYQQFRREDGFLHVTYAAQQVFG